MGRVWRRQIGFVFLGVAIVPVANIVVASKIIGAMPVFSATVLRFCGPKSDLCRPALADVQGVRVLPDVSNVLLVQAAAVSLACTVC
jgi:hypothetical protein